MAAEGIEVPHPAEQAGVLIGRAYAAAVSALAAPVRRPPAPTWHWRAARRAGTAVRAAAGGAADLVERRARTAPKRLVDGVKRLLRAVWGGSFKTLATRTSTTAFAAWWGWAWAADAGVTPRLACWTVLAASAVAAYAAGNEPDVRPVTRRERAEQQAAVRNLLSALHHMLKAADGLHLADLADQITARSNALGTPVKCTVGSLRQLLEPFGVPIRDQLALDGRTRPGIHAGDWRVWATRHGAPTTPRPGPNTPPHTVKTGPPTREEPLPPTEIPAETIALDAAKPQVDADALEISARDLGPTPAAGKWPADRYTEADLRLLAHARHAIGTARGAHLRDILAVAQGAGDCSNWSVARLRRALEDLDITVEDKLWLNGGNTRGVLATSLPDLTDTAEETA